MEMCIFAYRDLRTEERVRERGCGPPATFSSLSWRVAFLLPAELRAFGPACVDLIQRCDPPIFNGSPAPDILSSLEVHPWCIAQSTLLGSHSQPEYRLSESPALDSSCGGGAILQWEESPRRRDPSAFLPFPWRRVRHSSSHSPPFHDLPHFTLTTSLPGVRFWYWVGAEASRYLDLQTYSIIPLRNSAP